MQESRKDVRRILTRRPKKAGGAEFQIRKLGESCHFPGGTILKFTTEHSCTVNRALVQVMKGEASRGVVKGDSNLP